MQRFVLRSSAAALLWACVGGVCAAAAPGANCPVVQHHAPLAKKPQFKGGPLIDVRELKSDFDGWITQMKAINPDLARRVNVAALDAEAARIRKRLDHPMTRREAWTVFSRLNPLLRDGHSGVLMPNYRRELEAHIASNGSVVPIEVRFDRHGALRVFSADSKAVNPGDRVLSINGRNAKLIADSMLTRAIGETPEFRKAWAGRRFQMLYWYLYGDTGEYDISVVNRAGCVKRLRLHGARTLPIDLQSDLKPEDLFQYKIRADDIGYLRLDSFEGTYAKVLQAFTRKAFQAFKKDKIKALIIDVRENGGGDDPPWQRDVMEHITTKPYAQLSRYEVRITKKNADPGDVVGTVQKSAYDKRFVPAPNDPLRFAGPVYILPGPYTYSAAIQFVVAAQDFGIAKIAGEETAALSCQTGQDQSIAMPKTGLSAFTPLIAYTRPSGKGCDRGIVPDVPVKVYDVFPERTLKRLVNQISR